MNLIVVVVVCRGRTGEGVCSRVTSVVIPSRGTPRKCKSHECHRNGSEYGRQASQHLNTVTLTIGVWALGRTQLKYQPLKPILI